MKSILSLLALLAAPVAAQACEGVSVVRSIGAAGHCAPIEVQSFKVQGDGVQVLEVQPFVAVTPFAFVPQTVVVQQAHAQRVRVQNVRQPRQVVRTRSVVRSR